jgi:hypothetical protein
VLIEWEGVRYNEGRVVSELRNDGTMAVHRDGYATTIRLGKNHEELTKHKLKHLSVGTYGQLEKQQWILNQKIKKKKIEINEYMKKSKISSEMLSEILGSEKFKNWYKKKNMTKKFLIIN